MKRTIHIGPSVRKITCRKHQFIAYLEDGSKHSSPCEDIGVVILDTPRMVDISGNALAELTRAGVVVIIAGPNYLPSGMVLPFGGNSAHAQVAVSQATMSLPLKKRGWQRLIAAKVSAQAGNLFEGSHERNRLDALARIVKSGDPENVEAQAARIYWAKYFGSDFRRRRTSMAVENSMLNYGYTVLRATLARSMIATGLHPGISWHHSFRVNPFAFVDDAMEPLRPVVDEIVKDLLESYDEFSPPAKRELLNRISCFQLFVAGMVADFDQALTTYALELKKYVMSESRTFSIPVAVSRGRK